MIACRRASTCCHTRVLWLYLLPRTLAIPITTCYGYTYYRVLWAHLATRQLAGYSPSHYHQARLDVLFVEEAGQLPLAHLIGAAILTMAPLTMAILTMALLLAYLLPTYCRPTHCVRAPTRSA